MTDLPDPTNLETRGWPSGRSSRDPVAYAPAGDYSVVVILAVMAALTAAWLIESFLFWQMIGAYAILAGAGIICAAAAAASLLAWHLGVRG